MTHRQITAAVVAISMALSSTAAMAQSSDLPERAAPALEGENELVALSPLLILASLAAIALVVTIIAVTDEREQVSP